VLAIVEAASDLSDRPTRRRVVLVAAGDDNCHGDRRAAAEVLSGDVELRVVGLDLNEQIEKRFSTVVPTRNAKGTRQVHEALLWALYGPDPPSQRLGVSVHIVGLSSPETTSVLLRDVVTGAVAEMSNRGGAFAAKTVPGLYTATVTGDALGTSAWGQILVKAGAENRYTLDASPIAPVTLEAHPSSVASGDPISVHYWGAPPGEHWIAIAPAGAAIGMWTDRSRAAAPSDEINLRAPAESGEYELRFLKQLGNGVVRLIGRLPITCVPPSVTLEVSDTAILGEELSIAWQGPDQPGDHLTLAVAGANPAQRIACAFTTAGSPVVVTAPSDEGHYTVHYISGMTARSLAHTDVEVTHVPVHLEVPQTVDAGGTIVVDWSGPARERDYLTLATTDSPEEEYLAVHPASDGSPVSFVAPRRPGTYEIRYVKDVDDTVEGRVVIEVMAVEVLLQVPSGVRAGTRFAVVWQGPDETGDFIAVAPFGGEPRRRLDWAFTSLGSPANLAAPFSPGRYELRYVSGKDLEVLATVTLEIE
jgi:Ca-activated chloride channel family protein